MAHAAQQAFIAGVKARWPEFFVQTKVLEVGSCNINGTVRDFFQEPTLYVGVDRGPGVDVDVVCNGADYDTEECFDVVISTECFEHDPDWNKTFYNMIRLCRSGGLIIVTCATDGRPEHGTRRTSPADSAYATDYYKNLNVFDFEDNFPLGNWFPWYGFEKRGFDLYFYGLKSL